MSAITMTLSALYRLLAVPLNVEHELTRQRKWDKQETKEYMRHFNALKVGTAQISQQQGPKDLAPPSEFCV